MKIVKIDQVKIFNAANCVVLEYPLEYPDINGSVAKISGRYPENGFAVNEVCRELGYVINGKGSIGTEDQELELGEGDLVAIEPGEKFYWQGNFTLFLPCAPAWNPGQHKFID